MSSVAPYSPSPPEHTLPTGVACLALAVGPSLLIAVKLSHKPRSFWAVLTSNPGCQISCHCRAGTHPCQYSGGWEELSSCFPCWTCDILLGQLEQCPQHPCKLGRSIWFGISLSLGHHGGICTHQVCQRTHLLLSSKEGLGIADWSESSFSPAQGISLPDRNSWTCVSSLGRYPKS